MIAHSLPDQFFGPAQRLHGATYIVEASFCQKQLTEKNVVIDIGEATNKLKKVIQELNYQNLDDLPQFQNIFTTTEYLAKYIHNEIKKDLSADLTLKIILHESNVASASYED